MEKEMKKFVQLMELLKKEEPELYDTLRKFVSNVVAIKGGTNENRQKDSI
jgi:hypothetical protein